MPFRTQIFALASLVGCTPTTAPPRDEPAAEAHARPEPSSAAADALADLPLDRGRGPFAREHWGHPAPGDPSFRCERDADCTVVFMDCCDACNSGWELSVRVDAVERVKAAHAALDCELGASCTLKACGVITTAACRTRECVRRLDPTPTRAAAAVLDAAAKRRGRPRVPALPRFERNRVPPPSTADWDAAAVQPG